MKMSDIVSRRRHLKEKFKKRESIFSGWTSFGHPGPTEIFTRAGFDCIGIDIEHSTIDQYESQRIIAACHAAGVVCLPRVASHDIQMCRRLLDSGADGIIVPMIGSAQEMTTMIDGIKYPPVGRRGFGVARAQGYGFDFDEYTSTWNESSICIAQIESIDAVNNIEQILAVPNLDGVMVGPYDISGSLHVPGQLTHPKVIEASLKVVAACKRVGKSCGTHIIEPDGAKIKRALDEGYNFCVLASDVFVLNQWVTRIKQDIQSSKDQ